MIMCKEIKFVKTYLYYFICIFALMFAFDCYAGQNSEEAAVQQTANQEAISEETAFDEDSFSDEEADRDYDIMARSTLRTFIATMGGTIQEEYMLIMDGFREEYAELVQFLKDECVFILVPQAPKKEYEIEVAGDRLIRLKSTIANGDSLGSLLNGWITFPKILQLVDEGKKIYSLTSLKLNNPFSLLIDLNDKNLKQFEYEFDSTHKIIIHQTDDDYHVAVEKIVYDYELCFVEGKVVSNFYNAVIDQGENATFAIRLADVFSYDIDFAREIKEGDTFAALVEKRYRDGNFTGYGRIIAASFVNNNVLYEAFLFHDSEEDGKLSYFNRNGKALQKAFLRTPVHFTRISSHFTMARKHPILGVTRAHPAIDYAAPIGTPVMAVGDGTVERAAYTGGYGHLILLKHKGGLETQYAHLSGYAKGVRSGARVTQGQVIGYVGSTGLSTGPHLDFRIKKNGQYVNPDKIIIPSKAPLRNEQMPSYIDTIQQLETMFDDAEKREDFDAQKWLDGIR